MNTMMLVSHRLFTAALAENAAVRRPRPRPEKPVVIELARREAAAPWARERPVPVPPMMPREVWLDARLNARV